MFYGTSHLKMLRGAFVSFVAGIIFLSPLSSLFAATAEETIINTIWQNRKDSYLISSLNTRLAKKDVQILYDTEMVTHNLLRYAAEKKRYDLLDQISTVLLVAYPYLENRTTYTYYYKPGSPSTVTLPLNPPAPMWVNAGGEEVILVSSQFLALVSEAVHDVVVLPSANRTEAMNDLVKKYVPVLVDHYDRWVLRDAIFQVKGWGCAEGMYPHKAFLEKKLANGLGTAPSYCNAVQDTDLWILAGVADLLGSNAAAPTLAPISATVKSGLLAYMKSGTALVKARLTATTLKNRAGKTVTGLVFDRDVWRDHPTYDYAGYTGTAFPTDAQKAKAANAGWDTSHARRFVAVFDALLRNRVATKQSYPTDAVMGQLANQFAYSMTNRSDAERPIFANYQSGQNGWYRVNYGAAGFGYAPGDMTESALAGGFAFWKKYNPDIGIDMNAAWAYIKKGQLADPYAKSCYQNYARGCVVSYNQSNSLTLLEFLPSLIP